MGLLLAHGAVALLRFALPERELYGINIVRLDLIQVSSEVVLFASVVSLTAVLFGLAPAFRSTRIELNAAFKEDGSGVLQGWRVRSLDGAFVAGQVALAVVLTVSAVLLLRTVATLYSQDVGFEPDGLLVISVAKPRWELKALRSQIAAKARQNKEGVPTSEDIEPVRRWHESFDKRLEEVLSAIPGVQSVATAQQTPIARATEMLKRSRMCRGRL